MLAGEGDLARLFGLFELTPLGNFQTAIGSGRGAAWLARCNGVAEVGSSNLLAPTIFIFWGRCP